MFDSYESLGRLSASSSSILVALAVGVFAILTLFTQVGYLTPAWFVLSAVYAAICVTGILIFKNWAAAEILLSDRIQDAIDRGYELEEYQRAVAKGRIRKFFFHYAFESREGFLMAVFITMIVLAILLWLTFAFHMH